MDDIAIFVSAIKNLYKGEAYNITKIEDKKYIDSKKITSDIYIDNIVNVYYDTSYIKSTQLYELCQRLRSILDLIKGLTILEVILYLDGEFELQYFNNRIIIELVKDKEVNNSYWILKFISIIYKYFHQKTGSIDSCIKEYEDKEFLCGGQEYKRFKTAWFNPVIKHEIEKQKALYIKNKKDKEYNELMRCVGENGQLSEEGEAKCKAIAAKQAEKLRNMFMKDITNRATREKRLQANISNQLHIKQQFELRYNKLLDKPKCKKEMSKFKVKKAVWETYNGKLIGRTQKDLVGKGRCFSCLNEIKWGYTTSHGSHIIAESKQGPYNLDNIRICCSECNGRNKKRGMAEQNMYGWMIKNNMKGLSNIQNDKLYQAKLYLDNLLKRNIINFDKYKELLENIDVKLDYILQIELN